MNWDLVNKIVEAVLYEGYILYPYRPSATKNQQRFTFGRVYPQAFSQAQGGSEPCYWQTQSLVKRSDAGRPPAITAHARFLQPLARDIGRLPEPLSTWIGEAPPAFELTPTLHIDERLYQAWQEVIEQAVPVGPLPLDELIGQTRLYPFTTPAAHQWEGIHDAAGRMVGVVVRRQAALAGRLALSVEPSGSDLYRLTATVGNLTPLAEPVRGTEDEALLMRTLTSTHLILIVEAGEFISLMDPPPPYAAAAAACRQQGGWPVLVGDAASGESDMLLASPIILYDYPEIAPESMGNLFDSTEIDELLMLRVLTLTDEEKQAMRQVDEQARQILQRSEALSAEHLLRLHGVLRDLHPGPAG